MSRIALIISVLCTALLFPPTIAYTKDNVYFEHIGNEDGLSNMAVSSIVQDSRGFLWLGTQGGLNRYDGYEFKEYKKKPFDSNSLSHDLVQTLYMDENDVLWIGTYHGLNRLDLKTDEIMRYRNIPGDPTSLSNDVVVSINRDAGGNLWVGTLDGLNVFHKETGTFRRYLHDPENSTSLANNTVRAIYKDLKGKLWIGTYGGLCQYRPETDDFLSWRHDEDDPESIASNNVMVIAQQKRGELLLGTWGGGGLSRFDIQSGKMENFTLPDNRSYSMIVGYDGTIYIGSWGGGLTEFNTEQGVLAQYGHNSNDPSSLTHDIVYSLYMDPSDILWIGTNGGGINKMRKPEANFQFWSNDPEDPETLSKGKIPAVLKDSYGVLWIGTYNNGVDRYDPEQDRMVHYRASDESSGLINDTVNNIYEDSRRNLWVCTTEGLYRYDRSADRFERWFDESSENPLPDQIVYGVIEDIDGALWIGLYNSGLIRYFPETGETQHYIHDSDDPRSLSHNLIYTLNMDRRDNLWIGTNNGLNLYNRESDDFTCFYHDENDPTTLTSNTIYDLYEDRNQNLWIATSSGGLNLLDRETGTFSHFMTEDGLPSNTIFGILPDWNGRLWMSTMDHLVLFDPDFNSFLTLDEGKGFWIKEFARGHYADEEENLLYFGSSSGLYQISPGEFKQNIHEPPVYLTSFRVFDEEVQFPYALSEIRSIEVDYNDKFIAFEFAALDYVNPEKNQYAYMLEGFDADWVQSGSRRYASYTNLEPGRYTFRVRASNNDYIWNMNGLEVDLRVVPPFWRTPLAYIVYFLLAGGLIYLLINEMNRLEKQRFLEKTREIERVRLQELETEVQERRRVESELIQARDEAERANRTKSNFIANISHEIRTPLNAIIGYTQLLRRETNRKSIHDLLDIIRKSGNQLLTLINDMLDLSVIESGKLRVHRERMNLDEVVEDIYSTYGYRVGEKGLRFEARIEPGTPKFIYMDAHRLRQILFNLVGNALKFTDTGSIRLVIEGTRLDDEDGDDGLQETFGSYSFRVQDTGIGIPQEARESIFEAFTQRTDHGKQYGGTGLGLAITRELAEALGGSIELRSEVGEGSVFSVRFPKIRIFDEQENGSETGKAPVRSEAAPEAEIAPLLPGFCGEAEAIDELQRWIETEGLPHWNRISESFFLDDWKEFAADLQEKGSEYGCRDMVVYGRILAECIENSRISDLKRAGTAFPKLAQAIVNSS